MNLFLQTKYAVIIINQCVLRLVMESLDVLLARGSCKGSNRISRVAGTWFNDVRIEILAVFTPLVRLRFPSSIDDTIYVQIVLREKGHISEKCYFNILGN